jgi:hypothetical protein
VSVNNVTVNLEPDDNDANLVGWAERIGTDMAEAISEHSITTGTAISEADANTILNIIKEHETLAIEINIDMEEIHEKVLPVVTQYLLKGKLREYDAMVEEIILDTVKKEIFVQVTDRFSEETSIEDPAGLLNSITAGFDPPIFAYEANEGDFYTPMDTVTADSLGGTSAIHRAEHLYEYLHRNLTYDEYGETHLEIENTYQLDLVASLLPANSSIGAIPFDTVSVSDKTFVGILELNGTDKGRVALFEAGMFPGGLDESGRPHGCVIEPSEGAIDYLALMSDHASDKMRKAVHRRQFAA